MGNVFRTATKQAILDLIADHGVRSRFGQMLSDEDADLLAHRVVDLFEMTLELRSRTGMLGLGAPPSPATSEGTLPGRKRAAAASASVRNEPEAQTWSELPPRSAFPTTVHAGEFTDSGEPQRRISESTAQTPDPTFLGLKLPRQRKPITDAERQSFLRRR